MTSQGSRRSSGLPRCDGGVQHLHECRQRQRNGHNDQLRAFQRFCGFCCCITLTFGLTGVCLHDVIDQLVDRIEANFTGVTFISRGAAYLTCQNLAVAVSGIHRHQRGEANTQRMVCQLFRIKLDTHRQTLHHFDPVTGGVLRRQQREALPVPISRPTTLPVYFTSSP